MTQYIVVKDVVAKIHNLKKIDTYNLKFSCEFDDKIEELSYIDNYSKLLAKTPENKLGNLGVMLDITDNNITYVPLKFDTLQTNPKIHMNKMPKFWANIPNFTFWINIVEYGNHDQVISMKYVNQIY